MNWLADENISGRTVSFLRRAGCDVVAVSERIPMAPDEDVIALARAEGRILLSFDRDHGDLIFNRGIAPPPAVVYLRLYPATPEELSEVLARVLALGEAALMGLFTVVTKHGLRQRPLPRG